MICYCQSTATSWDCEARCSGSPCKLRYIRIRPLPFFSSSTSSRVYFLLEIISRISTAGWDLPSTNSSQGRYGNFCYRAVIARCRMFVTFWLVCSWSRDIMFATHIVVQISRHETICSVYIRHFKVFTHLPFRQSFWLCTFCVCYSFARWRKHYLLSDLVRLLRWASSQYCSH